MSDIRDCRWQYVSERGEFGGWFTDAGRAEVDANPEIEPHTWRALPQSEIDSMAAYVGRLAYEQS